jgi:CheY-like chemotaxis protein
MDGIEATRRIRQLPGGDKVKIIAVTASAFREQQEELRAAGMDDYVSKPYRFAEIYHSLEQYLGLRFVYRDAKLPEEVATANVQQLAVLPAALRSDLRHALESLDPQAIEDAIKQVTEHDHDLGGSLARIAEGFDYQVILDALREVDS